MSEQDGGVLVMTCHIYIEAVDLHLFASWLSIPLKALTAALLHFHISGVVSDDVERRREL